MEEAAAGSDVNIGSILDQQLHALQASLLYGDVQRTVTSVELIRALGIDQGLGVAGIPVNLQQRQDAGIDPVLKVQHGLHQARLSSGAFCKERGEAQAMLKERLDHLPVWTANLGSREPVKRPLGRLRYFPSCYTELVGTQLGCKILTLQSTGIKISSGRIVISALTPSF